MILFRNLIQLANYNEEDPRTSKKRIGKDILEFSTIGKTGKQTFV